MKGQRDRTRTNVSRNVKPRAFAIIYFYKRKRRLERIRKV